MRDYSDWNREALILELGEVHNLISKQRNEIVKLGKEVNSIRQLKTEHNPKLCINCKVPTWNERGAGRKSKITTELKAQVRQLREDGLSYRAIAQELDISSGLAYKTYNQAD